MHLPVDNTNWGKVPRNRSGNAFSNEPADREYQDVGFDGNRNDSERVKRSQYLTNLQSLVTPSAFANAQADPSSDDYTHYRNDAFSASDGILKRYKNFNNPQGNSPVSSSGSDFSSAATLYPDAEDLNRDNTLNQTEEYFQYIVDIKPPTAIEMQIGQNYIVDKKTVGVGLADGTSEMRSGTSSVSCKIHTNEDWQYPDFKSIRFIRMFLTDFLIASCALACCNAEISGGPLNIKLTVPIHSIQLHQQQLLMLVQ
jgi:cell surface protein SprA